MEWLMIVLIIIVIGAGLWGWIARAKWSDEQAKKIKRDDD